LLALAGCGGLKLVPVSGKVTLNGKPLSGGGVSFSPDASRGNKARVSCLGRINAQGHYELSTSGVKGSDSGKGAPLGWYKVTLVTTLPGSPEISLPGKYLDPDKTPLSVEVVAKPEPGRYDFELTR
jgi:hypothetical protein